MKDLTLKIRLTADNKGLVGAVKASGVQLQQLNHTVRATGPAAAQGAAGLLQVDEALQSGGRSADAFAAGIGRAHAYLLGFLSFRGLQALGDYADQWSNLNARVAMVTASQAHAEHVMSALADTARRTETALQLTAEAYLSNTRTLTELGYDTERQIALNDALNNALMVSGAKGQRAETVMNALSKALASGALRGINFNTVLEQGGRVVEALADGLGVTTLELRAMSEQGLLTTAKVVDALISQMEQLREEAEGMPIEIRDGMLLLGEATGQLVGQMSAVSGISQSIGDGLAGVSEVIRSWDAEVVVGNVVLAMQALAVVTAARLTPALVGATQAKLANLKATLALPPAAVRAAQAESARTSGLLMQARAEMYAAQAAGAHGLALMELRARATMAATAHRQSVAALAAAQRAAAGATGALALAGRGLLAAVGGVPGLIVGGVAALGMWAVSSSGAQRATRDFREELLQLQKDSAGLERYGLEKQIRETQQAIEQMQAGLSSRVSFWEVVSGSGGQRKEAQADLLRARQLLAALQEQLARVKSEAAGEITPAVDISAVQAHLDKLRERIDLVGQSEISVAQYRAAQELEAAATQAAAEGNQALAAAYREAIPAARALAAELYTKEQATREAVQEQARFEQALAGLLATLDPVSAATASYVANVELLDRAWTQGLLSGTAHEQLVMRLAGGQTTAAEAAAALAEEYDALLAALDPLHAKFVEMADLEFKAWELFDKGAIKDMNQLAAVLEKIRKKGRDTGVEVGGGMKTATDAAEAFATSVKDSATSMRDMYAQGSSAYTGLTMLIEVMNIGLGVAAVLKQYSEGDVYTAFARGAAMIAAVAALGVSVGGGGSGGSSGGRGLSANFGADNGGVLGGGESDAVAGALAAIEGNTADLVNINRGMLTALRALSGDLDNMTNQIARTFGVTALDALQDYAFVRRAGIEISGTLADPQVGGWAVADKPAEYDEGDAWASLRGRNQHEGFTLDDASEDIIRAALGNMHAGLLSAATTLGLDVDAVGRALEAAVIDPIRLRLDNLDPAKQAEAIEQAFNEMFDGLVATVLPELAQFQAVGESLGETLARVSTAVDLTRESMRALGMQMSATDPEEIMGASLRMAQYMGGADAFADAISSFSDNFLSQTDQFAARSAQLNRALHETNLELPRTREGYLELLQAQDMATEAGAQHAAQLLRLQDAADDYYARLEQGIKAIVEGDTSVSAAYRAQQREVEALLAAYDGSAWAMDDLNAAYAVQQDLAYMLAQAWQEVAAQAQLMLGNLAEQIRQDLMNEEELYNYRRERVDALVAALADMTDPAEVAATIAEIEHLTGQMWQSLSEEQKKLMGQEFLGFLEGTDALLQERLQASLDELDIEGERAALAIEQVLSEAAGRLTDSSHLFSSGAAQFHGAVESMAAAVSAMSSAASTMQAAANTPIRVQVIQTFSEVG